MLLDRAADLALLAIQVAENQVNLERIAGGFRGRAQLLDRRIDLVGDEEIEPEHVVRRLARAAAIDPAAVLQLVALPGLADGQAGEQREQHEQGDVGAHHDRRSVLAHDRVPAVLRAKDQLDEFAHRAAAAARRC